jgi:hypothetical protein
LNCFNVVDVTGPGLNVIKNVVFTKTPVADDLNVFNKSLLLRLRNNASGSCKADQRSKQ